MKPEKLQPAKSWLALGAGAERQRIIFIDAKYRIRFPHIFENKRQTNSKYLNIKIHNQVLQVKDSLTWYCV